MIIRGAVVALLAALGSTISVPSRKRDYPPGVNFNWGSEKIRGVNIGGWLVLEPWITPSIFQSVDQSLGIVDEYTLCERLPEQAPSILRHHWDTWASFADFQKIASAGFNLVRIPVGYWAYDNSGSPYIQGAADYVETAIDWARHTSPPLKVLIDLHGAPGSQNGWDNSGKRGGVGWLADGGPYGATSQQTLGVLRTIAEKYAVPEYQDAVVGIELLNEPLSTSLDGADLRQFFREGYGRVRAVSDAVVVVLQDAFQPPASYNGFMTPADRGCQWVALDHHYYTVFDDATVGLLPWQRRQHVCNTAGSYSGADKWSFIGEWTAAMTDCAPFLNGYGIGARYDGTRPGSTYHGSCAGKSDISTWDADMRNDTRGFVEAQLDAFEANTDGWVFWNFKTEAAHEWDLFVLLDNGVFPDPVTDRKFGPVCSVYY